MPNRIGKLEGVKDSNRSMGVAPEAILEEDEQYVSGKSARIDERITAADGNVGLKIRDAKCPTRDKRGLGRQSGSLVNSY